MRIGVIGGGISGLTAAYYLQKKGHDCVVLEATDRTGGCIFTEKKEGRLFENGPNSLLLTEDHISLIEELNIINQLQEAESVNKDRYILRNGEYNILPSGPKSFITNNFFSWKTKLTILTEMWRKNKANKEEETLYEFFERRFNKEVCDYAVDPFVRGIYAGDPKQLKIKASFPTLFKADKDYGSIIKGLIKIRKVNKENGVGVKRKNAYSFTDGIQTLTNALSGKLDVKYQSKVNDISLNEGVFTVNTNDKQFQFDKIIIATPPIVTSEILKNLNPKVSEALQNLYTPPMCVVHSVFKKEDAKGTPIGFGGLNPSTEKTFTAGSLWSSCIFPNRVGENEVLITSFVGGSHTPEYVALDDSEITTKVANELKSTLGFTGKPIYQKTYKWKKAIPQYDQNVLRVWNAIDSNPIKGLHYSANWKDGIAVPDCIDKGKKLSESI